MTAIFKKVFPFSPVNNSVNNRGRNAIKPCQLMHCSTVGEVNRSDVSHLSLCEFCHSVGFTWMHHSFLCCVFIVLIFGSKPQVSGVDARSDVTTGTIMANTEAIWDGSEMEKPACNVREYRCVTLASVNPAVAFIGSARPQPAGFGDSDFRKEPSWKGWRQSLAGQEIGGYYVHT